MIQRRDFRTQRSASATMESYTRPSNDCDEQGVSLSGSLLCLSHGDDVCMNPFDLSFILLLLQVSVSSNDRMLLIRHHLKLQRIEDSAVGGVAEVLLRPTNVIIVLCQM